MDQSGSAAIFGQKESIAKQRVELSKSRDRLQDTLLSKGLLKIDACFEAVRHAAAEGRPFDAEVERMNKELTQLLQDAAANEGLILSDKMEASNIPAYLAPDGSDESTSTAMDTEGISTVLKTIGTTVPIPLPGPVNIKLILIIIGAVIDLLGWLMKSKKSEEDAAKEASEKLAAYYKWLNDLRDQETNARANYTKAVTQFLETNYDVKLAELDQQLASVSSDCAAYTKVMDDLQKLMNRVNEELAELAQAM